MFVRQNRVCLSVMYATVGVLQALNKIISGFSPCEFKAGCCSGLWARGFSCAMEKRDLFSCQGGFWGKPPHCLPQPAFKELKVLTSPLLKSFHPSERVTSSPTGTAHLPLTTSPIPTTAAVHRVTFRFMGNVQSQRPGSTHSHLTQSLHSPHLCALHCDTL